MIYFAIGDVHGEADKLRRLHAMIMARIAAEGQPARIVHLGDYVNRGPDSRGAIEAVMALRGHADVIALKGNHDDRATRWDASKAHRRGLAPAHLDWLARLPTLHYDRARRLAFVHAGIDPAVFPNCDDYCRTRTRSPAFFDRRLWPDREELRGLTVVHGHTAESKEPTVWPHRVNVDTGACFGGPLTAAVLREGRAPEFLKAD